MKKFYIGFAILFVLGIGAGIYYLEVVRDGQVKLPDDVVMESAFGNEVDFAELPKKVRLVEFMYTRCPDICPITTLEMAKLKSTLEKEGIFGDKVEFLTITIDPKRDSTEVLRDYANRFEVDSDDEGWLFLRATDLDEENISKKENNEDEEVVDDTKKVADNFNFPFRDPGSGEIIHHTEAYLMDGSGNLLEKFTMGEDFDRDRVYKRIKRTLK